MRSGIFSGRQLDRWNQIDPVQEIDHPARRAETLRDDGNPLPRIAPANA
jgi:hypothetical protein